MRVLLADDHPLVRDGIASLLATRGIEIVGEARDGVEAIEQVRQLHPDLVIMDITMPRMDGLEATRLIKAESPEVKVVILTVSEDERNLFDAIKSGAQGYLVKNMESKAFFEAVAGVARGEAALNPTMAARILDEFSRLAQTAGRSDPDALTDREQEVLQLVVDGRSNREIAQELVIQESTVKFHLGNILAKLHARNRAQVVAYAMQHGIQPRH